MEARRTFRFNRFAASDNAVSSYCTVSVIVVGFDNGANVPVTVSV